MAEFILSADAEAVAVGYFNAALPSTSLPTVKASTKVPNPRPAKFFKFVLVGGFNRDHLTSVPRLALEAYAATEVAAAQMQSIGLALLWQACTDGLMGATTVHNLNVVSRPQNLPDPNVTDMARYSSTIELDMRGTVA